MKRHHSHSFCPCLLFGAPLVATALRLFDLDWSAMGHGKDFNFAVLALVAARRDCWLEGRLLRERDLARNTLKLSMKMEHIKTLDEHEHDHKHHTFPRDPQITVTMKMDLLHGKSALKMPRGLMLLAGGASSCLVVVSSKIRLFWGGQKKGLILHDTLQLYSSMSNKASHAGVSAPPLHPSMASHLTQLLFFHS